MRKDLIFLTLSLILSSLSYVDNVKAQNRSPVSLTGTIRSDAEGLMEGVLVTAKGLGSTIAVTVVSDEHGRYSFPAERLQPAVYRLSIRASGYELNDSDPATVEIGTDRPVTIDLKLTQTEDLTSQLSNAEWLLSVPGSKEQKMELHDCVHCHTLDVITKSHYDAEGFAHVLKRMEAYSYASMIANLEGRRIPYASLDPDQSSNEEEYVLETDQEFAEYLASINLSSSANGTWNYKLKTLPRPKGKATKVIITQYDLPSPMHMPHDAEVDSEGMVWYTDFARARLGRLNPDTGAVTEWSLPAVRPAAPEGSLDVRLDKDGNPWIGRLYQTGVAKLEKRTEKVTAWQIPAEMTAGGDARTGMVTVTPDGSVWTKSPSTEKLYRLDTKIGEWSMSPIPGGDHMWYGLVASRSGDRLYMFSLGKGAVAELDLKAGKKVFDVYPTPTPDSGSRRGAVDYQDRVWFAEYYAGKIGMFDPNTKQIQEWDVSNEPFAGPYDVAPDMSGDVWAGGMHSDHVYRLNPDTGEVTAYLLPDLSTNIRRMNADDDIPVSVWIGQNHNGKILRLEPLAE